MSCDTMLNLDQKGASKQHEDDKKCYRWLTMLMGDFKIDSLHLRFVQHMGSNGYDADYYHVQPVNTKEAGVDVKIIKVFGSFHYAGPNNLDMPVLGAYRELQFLTLIAKRSVKERRRFLQMKAKGRLAVLYYVRAPSDRLTDQAQLLQRDVPQQPLPFFIHSTRHISLEDVMRYSPRGVLSEKTSLQLALGCLACLDVLHEMQWTHRAVCPRAFALRLSDVPGFLSEAELKDSVMLVELSTIQPFPRGREPKVVPFFGVTKYCSPRIHGLRLPTPADDVLSVLYMLIEWQCGKLPWSMLKDYDKIQTTKLELPFSAAFRRLDAPVQKCIKMVMDHMKQHYALPATDAIMQLLHDHMSSREQSDYPSWMAVFSASTAHSETRELDNNTQRSSSSDITTSKTPTVPRKPRALSTNARQRADELHEPLLKGKSTDTTGTLEPGADERVTSMEMEPDTQTEHEPSKVMAPGPTKSADTDPELAPRPSKTVSNETERQQLAVTQAGGTPQSVTMKAAPVPANQRASVQHQPRGASPSKSAHHQVTHRGSTSRGSRGGPKAKEDRDRTKSPDTLRRRSKKSNR